MAKRPKEPNNSETAQKEPNYYGKTTQNEPNNSEIISFWLVLGGLARFWLVFGSFRTLVLPFSDYIV